MALFDFAVNLCAPGQLQLDDYTHPFSWGWLLASYADVLKNVWRTPNKRLRGRLDHYSLISLGGCHMPVRWHAAEWTVKWRSTDRLFSPMRTYCVLGYLLLEQHWSATLIRTVQTMTFDPRPSKGVGGGGVSWSYQDDKGVSFLFWKFSSRDFFGDRKIWQIQIYIDIFGSLI